MSDGGHLTALVPMRSRTFNGNVYILKSDLLKYLEDGKHDLTVAGRHGTAETLAHIISQIGRVS